jgi:hypothetical protein
MRSVYYKWFLFDCLKIPFLLLRPDNDTGRILKIEREFKWDVFVSASY